MLHGRAYITQKHRRRLARACRPQQKDPEKFPEFSSFSISYTGTPQQHPVPRSGAHNAGRAGTATAVSPGRSQAPPAPPSRGRPPAPCRRSERGRPLPPLERRGLRFPAPRRGRAGLGEAGLLAALPARRGRRRAEPSRPPLPAEAPRGPPAARPGPDPRRRVARPAGGLTASTACCRMEVNLENILSRDCSSRCREDRESSSIRRRRSRVRAACGGLAAGIGRADGRRLCLSLGGGHRGADTAGLRLPRLRMPALARPAGAATPGSQPAGPFRPAPFCPCPPAAGTPQGMLGLGSPLALQLFCGKGFWVCTRCSVLLTIRSSLGWLSQLHFIVP